LAISKTPKMAERTPSETAAQINNAEESIWARHFMPSAECRIAAERARIQRDRRPRPATAGSILPTMRAGDVMPYYFCNLGIGPADRTSGGLVRAHATSVLRDGCIRMPALRAGRDPSYS